MKTILLLLASNIFMTFAWYGHLKNMKHSPLIMAIIVSWGLAFFEYSLQVPANRIGYQTFTLGQLKIIQEIITMIVFAGFAYWYMDKPLSWNYLYAGLCMVGAAYFIFRDSL
ncbi:MAG: DMT family protein [Chlorobium sp.]|nr:MAG: DMT family protein [Chlorobium sp.]